MKKLALLLDAMFPAAPDTLRISANEHAALAYRYALSDYTYPQVREGVLAAGRKSRLYPSVAEIIAGIPASEPSAREKAPPMWMLRYIQKRGDRHTRSVSRYAREHGLTWQEAEEVMP